MAEQQQEKFVVMSTLVNDHRQGDVIHADQLKTFDPEDNSKVRHDARQRLLDMGAIRPATEAEAGLARVPATQVGLSSAQTLALQTLDATIAKLTDDVAAHEERARSHERLRGVVAPLPSPEEDPAFAMAIQERQARIEHLRGRLEMATGQADEHREEIRQADDKRRESAPDRQELMTGQAIPSQEEQGEQPAGQQQTNAQRDQAAREQAQAAQRQRQEQEARQREQAAERKRQQTKQAEQKHAAEAEKAAREQAQGQRPEDRK